MDYEAVRFGITEAHGKGMALQENYLTDKGALVANADGTFAIDAANIKDAVRDLTHDLLTLEATGDYAGARSMLDRLAVLRPAMKQALADLEDIPVDIDPVPVTADQIAAK